MIYLTSVPRLMKDTIEVQGLKCCSAFFFLFVQFWPSYAYTEQHCRPSHWWLVWSVCGDEGSPLPACCHVPPEVGSGSPANMEGCCWPDSAVLPAGLPGTSSLNNKYKQYLPHYLMKCLLWNWSLINFKTCCSKDMIKTFTFFYFLLWNISQDENWE